MGSGTFDSRQYRVYATSSTIRADGTAKSTHEVFTQQAIHNLLDPKNITVRESCDSEDSPESRAIIIGLDVTGSMGMIAHSMVKDQLGQLMNGILDNQCIKHPHLMFMAIGDAACDRSPLQVSQFEADIRIAQQLTDIYVEGGGGGNDTESYDLPWYFAATRTKIDCFDKRNQKGLIFTIGDEMPPNGFTKHQLNSIFGVPDQVERYTASQLLDMAREKYDVFHIIVEEGQYARRAKDRVYNAWTGLLGKRAIRLNDYKKLSDVIVSVIRVNEGEDPDQVIDSFQDSATKETVRHALYNNSQ